MSRCVFTASAGRRSLRRRGASTIDYVLTFAIVLPLAAFMFYVAPRIMNLVYEMTTVLISWPFSQTTWGG